MTPPTVNTKRVNKWEVSLQFLLILDICILLARFCESSLFIAIADLRIPKALGSNADILECKDLGLRIIWIL